MAFTAALVLSLYVIIIFRIIAVHFIRVFILLNNYKDMQEPILLCKLN